MIFLNQDVVGIERGESSALRRRCRTGAFTPVFPAGSAFCCEATNPEPPLGSESRFCFPH